MAYANLKKAEPHNLYTFYWVYLYLVTGLVLVFFTQAEPYIGITPGCAASESGVTSPELLIMFP